ncbi:hypothetical protein AB0R12_38730, partial [Streptomyces niveus]
MTTYRESRALSPPLPEARGALSAAVCAALGTGTAGPLPPPGSAAVADPFGDDLQLALYVLGLTLLVSVLAVGLMGCGRAVEGYFA